MFVDLAFIAFILAIWGGGLLIRAAYTSRWKRLQGDAIVSVLLECDGRSNDEVGQIIADAGARLERQKWPLHSWFVRN